MAVSLQPHKERIDKVISPEEKALLAGSISVQRGICMDADSDVIDVGRLLDGGLRITIRPHN